MKNNLIWSLEAKLDYSDNIDYLIEYWSINAAQQFIDKVHHILKLLPSMPEMFPLSNYQNVRKGIICKQITILYQVFGTEIILLRFWNNKQDPSKFKYLL